MSYLVLARRFRPQSFAELVGQEGVTRTLRNAIAADKIHHAYLFCGPRGTGKTSAARILAKSLNCEKGPTAEPCNECDICTRISTGDDYDVIEMDAASNRGVDTIRELRENAQYATGRARYKIYIIDEVHMLTSEAFNALLKTLEEPPDHVKFIFATTEPQKILPTVHSRCQRFDFRRLGIPDIVNALDAICKREEVEASDAALHAIARRARGGMRDALSLLDQLINFGAGTITPELVGELTGSVEESALTGILDAAASGDPKAAVAATAEVIDAGIEPVELADALLERLRELMLVSVCGGDSDLVALADDDREAVTKLAASLGEDKVLYAMDLLTEARRRCAVAAHPRIPMEMAIVRLARTGDLADLSELAGQVSALVDQGGVLAAPADRAARSGPTSSTPAARAKPSTPRTQAPSTSAPQPAPKPQAQAAPAPQASPAPQAPPEPAPNVDLKTVRAQWDAVRAAIAAESSTIGSFFDEAVPQMLDGDKLTISLPKDWIYQAELLSSPQRRPVISGAFKKVFGRPLDCQFVTTGTTVTPEPAEPAPQTEPAQPAPQAEPTEPANTNESAPARSSEPSSRPLVSKAVEKLKGRIVAQDRGNARNRKGE